MLTVALDGLDRGVGRDLHVGRAEQRRAGVATRDGHDGRHHQVLDEGTGNGDGDRHPDAVVDHLNEGRAAVVPVGAAATVAERLECGPVARRARSVEESAALRSTGRVVVALALADLAGDGRSEGAGHLLGNVGVGEADRAPAKDARSTRRAHAAGAVAKAGRVERLGERDVLQLVGLLVVDHDVHVRRRQAVDDVEDGRRRHAVELADLRRALQHLDRVLVVRDLERHRREDAEAAEGASLVAGLARLKVGDGALAALDVLDLLLRRERHVEEELGRDDQHVRRHGVARHAASEKTGAMVRKAHERQ